ncbi:hypothetical protein BC941DRAFT_1953 [Chlamydoabsidia padenii]|nr:hypothetical protein BC941DRAFT_1953 [Chlamydoabsidia padenii]
MNYMVHQGYPVVPKPFSTVTTSPSPSLSPLYPQQHYQQQNINKQQNSRAVIPSKRAAQNRAAQKAFRQRKDQYIKDLEKKSKEMDQWLQDRDSVMVENRRLKSLVHELESRIASLTGESMPSSTLGEQQQQSTRSPSPPLSPSLPTHSTDTNVYSDHRSSLSPTTTSSIPPIPSTSGNVRSSSPPSQTIEQTTNIPSSSYRLNHPQSASSPTSSPTHPITPSHSFLPIPLRPHSFVPTKEDDVTSPLSPNSVSFGVVAPAGSIASTTMEPPSLPPQQPTTGSENAVFDLDLDPFFDDDLGFPRMDDQLDFVGHSNNSGQVLDDLFAMLQTRQRPQIPLQPTAINDDASYYMMDQVITGNSSSLT